MIYARCSENGANETGKEMHLTGVALLLREDDEEVYPVRHQGDGSEVGPDQDPQPMSQKFLL